MNDLKRLLPVDVYEAAYVSCTDYVVEATWISSESTLNGDEEIWFPEFVSQFADYAKGLPVDTKIVCRNYGGSVVPSDAPDAACAYQNSVYVAQVSKGGRPLWWWLKRLDDKGFGEFLSQMDAPFFTDEERMKKYLQSRRISA